MGHFEVAQSILAKVEFLEEFQLFPQADFPGTFLSENTDLADNQEDSSYLTHDIYKRVLNTQASSEKEEMVGRLVVAVFAVMTYLVSLLQPGSLVGIGLVAFGGFAQLTPLLLVSLYWKRTTTAGMVTALIASEGFYMGSKFIPGIPTSYWGWDSSMIAIVIGTGLVLLVSSFGSRVQS